MSATKLPFEDEEIKMVGNDTLPKDLMLNILSRLSVKTIKRCMRVCKSWFATFRNPEFIRNHYISNNITASNRNILVQAFKDDYRPLGDSLDYDYYSLSSKETIEVIETRSLLSPIHKFNYGRMNGECEGLICLYSPLNTRSVALFNPATRQVIILPHSCIKYPMVTRVVPALGLGYDYTTNDYKVVRFVCGYQIGGLGHFSCTLKTYVELYSLSSNSWKEITFPGQCPCDKNVNTYLNGCYHWLMKETDNILIFDMYQETFQTMMFPANLLQSGIGDNSFPKLSVFNNHLALFIRCSHVTDCFEIHVMKQYGFKESWTKQLVIGPIQGVGDILGSWNGGDEWFFRTAIDICTHTNQLKLYDSNTKMVQDLEIHSTWPIEVVMFTENLLFLPAER